MANQLKVAKVLSIQTLHAQGWSQRRIARELGIDRETFYDEARVAIMGMGFCYPGVNGKGGMSKTFCRSDHGPRKLRIAKPRKIQVTLSDTNVEFDESGSRATVTFRQDYRSDALKSVNSKTLVMTRAGDKWLIQQERSGG